MSHVERCTDGGGGRRHTQYTIIINFPAPPQKKHYPVSNFSARCSRPPVRRRHRRDLPSANAVSPAKGDRAVAGVGGGGNGRDWCGVLSVTSLRVSMVTRGAARLRCGGPRSGTVLAARRWRCVRAAGRWREVNVRSRHRHPKYSRRRCRLHRTAHHSTPPRRRHSLSAAACFSSPAITAAAATTSLDRDPFSTIQDVPFLSSLHRRVVKRSSSRDHDRHVLNVSNSYRLFLFFFSILFSRKWKRHVNDNDQYWLNYTTTSKRETSDRVRDPIRIKNIRSQFERWQ